MNTAILTIVAIAVFMAARWAKQKQNQTREMQERLKKGDELSRQQAEQLKEHNDRNRQLVQNANDALFIFDQKDGALIEINRQAEELLGYTQGEVTPLTFKVLFSKEHRQRLLRMISTIIKKGHAETNGIKFRRKDGSQFIGEIKARSGRIGNRQIVYGNFRDITQTASLQLELERHNLHLTLLNQISNRVAEGHNLPHTLEIILDEVIRSFSVSGGGIFLLEQRGTEMKLALHRNIPEDVVEDLNQMKPGEGLAGKVVKTARHRHSTNLQKDHRRTSSAVRADNWRAFLAVPFIAEEEALGVLFIFDRGHKVFSREDIRLTQAIGRQLGPLLKNAELFDELQWQHRINFASLRELERSRTTLRDNLDQLEQHHRTLQGLNQMKSAFLSLASHELRTPLTTILSGAEFLQSQTEELLGNNEKRALNVIIRASQRLNHIVDDLLDAARLEARTLYIARESFNPFMMINELITEFKPSYQKNKINLELQEFPDDTVLRGDAHHLKRALARLLENAIKFTPEGGMVHIAGRTLQQEIVVGLTGELNAFSESFFDGALAESYLQISISDSGIGIDKADHLRIFDKFQEVGDISTHSTSQAQFGGKGVGLGLTLAKGIIETHDGLVWVESAGADQGSCFSALLPLANSHEERYVLG
ncbi:PAS domain S-box protein [Deltaproteobacteria bacterium IMCC39524]|nr:PAS domain S-box protein [Deltaproteobacteria bacterium IMCC39524]